MKTWKSTIIRVVVIASFIAIACIIRSRRSWRLKSRWLASRLMNQHQHQQQQQQHHAVLPMTLEECPSFSTLPMVVKTYFAKALLVKDDSDSHDDNEQQQQHHSIPWIQAVTFQQRGVFRMQNKWIRFTATQYISAMEPVGFLWDATLLMTAPLALDIPVSVRDVYLQGKGSLEASLAHAMTLANLHDNPQIDLGEVQRWMAEAVLVPTALLPSKQITWTGQGDDEEEENEKKEETRQAKLTMNETVSGTVAELIIEFGVDDGLVSAVHGMRPKTAEDGSGKIALSKWEGKMYDYQRISGLIMIPTRMDAGWRNEETGELEVYFKGENFDFDYKFA